MTHLQIQLLGTFQVLQNGRSLTGFRTDKIRALLAYLAVESDRPHRRDSLAALFWPDMDDQKARYNLRLSLHRLRQTLGDDAQALQVDRHSAQFDAARTRVDVYQFTQAMTAVSSHDHLQAETCTTCKALLEKAVSQYKGDFLPGIFLADDLPFAEWVTTRRERLHQDALQALHWLAVYHQLRDQMVRTIPYARRQLELEPWRESAHRQMMQALAATNQRAAALNQYETCCRILRDELGIRPAAETTALFKQLMEEKTIGHLSVQITDNHSRKHQHFPIPTATPFIGRQEEQETLNNLLSKQTSRLVTIVGAGGMGKTGLAQACLNTQTNRFTHGVYFVPLMAVTNPDHILPAIAKALNFAPDQGDVTYSDSQQLLDYLQSRQLLLVLDNFEQLLASNQAQSSTAVLQRILLHSPETKLLITSRERLHIQTEQVLPLGGLPYPTSHEREIETYAAVQLFQQSARRLQPNFSLTPDDSPHLSAICRLLEGMPLGLELAATWVDLLPLAEISTEIQDSLDFLAADVYDWPDRHRSMRAVFDTSWARLSQPEQDFIRQLSLFHGGFTRAAVQAIVGDSQKRTAVLGMLSSLVSKSLLRYDRLADRYSQHGLLRQYVAEKLADKTALERYGRYYCTWLADQTPVLKGGRQKAALAAIEADIENIRAAWNWAVANQDLPLLTEAAFSLGTFFYRQGRHQEGQSLFSQAAAVLERNFNAANPLTLARLLYWQAMFEPAAMARQSLLQKALALLETAAPDPKNRTGQAAILLELGIIASGQGQHETAEPYFEQSLIRCRLVGDRWGEANVLFELGVRAWRKGDYPLAEQWFSHCLQLRRQLNDSVGMAVALEGLVGTTMFSGQIESARAFLGQSLAVYQDLDDQIGIARIKIKQSQIDWYQHLKGLALFEEGLSSLVRLGARRNVALWTVIYAMLKADEDMETAVKKAVEGRKMCLKLGHQRGVGIAQGVLSRAALVKGNYPEALALAETYLRTVETLSLAVERTDALIWVGWASLALGRNQKAQKCVLETLEISNYWRVACLDLAAILLAHRFPDQSDQAWQVLGYGEFRYGRHRGAVSQQMLTRFMPSAMKTVPSPQIVRLKEQGKGLDWEMISSTLLSTLA